MNQNSQTLSSAASDEAAVRSLYQQLMDGWNAAIGDAFAAPLKKIAIWWGLMVHISRGVKKLPHFINTYLICFSKALDL